MRRTFNDALALGTTREDLRFRDLCADDWLVERTHQLPTLNGHGPRLFGSAELVPPDFRICKLGIWLAVELRAKSTSTTGRITGQEEHGIDWRSWINLRDYERRTDEPTYLVVDEIDTGSVLACRISNLKPRGDCPTSVRGTSMAYFTRAQFGEWLTVLNRAVMRRDWPARDRARVRSHFDEGWRP